MSILQEDFKIALSEAMILDEVCIDNTIKSVRQYKISAKEQIEDSIKELMKTTEIDRCLDEKFWLEAFNKFINFDPTKKKFFVRFRYYPITFHNTPCLSISLYRNPFRGNWPLNTIDLSFYINDVWLAAWINMEINKK